MVTLIFEVNGDAVEQCSVGQKSKTTVNNIEPQRVKRKR